MDQPASAFLPRPWEQLDESVRSRWGKTIAKVVPPPLLIELTAGNLQLEDFDAKELAAKVGQDAVLAGVVLAAANSAKYGLITPITSIQRAIVHMGFVMVKAAIASYQMEATFGSFRGVPSAHLRRSRLWSAGASVIAHHWAQAAEFEEPSRVSTLALLALLGPLVYGMEEPQPGQEYQDFLEEPSRFAFEQATWGVCGMVLSGQVARAWRLPDSVCAGLDKLIWAHYPSGQPQDQSAVIAAASIALASRYLRDRELKPLEVFAEPGFEGINAGLSEHSLGPVLASIWPIARLQRELSIVSE
jgi:HD-like signal output (HDOD) protein